MEELASDLVERVLARVVSEEWERRESGEGGTGEKVCVRVYVCVYCAHNTDSGGHQIEKVKSCEFHYGDTVLCVTMPCVDTTLWWAPNRERCFHYACRIHTVVGTK